MKNTNKKHVLICDANKDVRDVVKMTVEEVYPETSIVEAISGTEAYLKVERQKFDLVITDIKIPGRDGLQLIRSFNLMDEKLRPKAVLVLSAEINSESSKEILGSVSYLPKPCPENVLKEAIKRILIPPTENSNAKANIEFFNPFINGTILVLSTTASTQVAKEKVFIRSGDQISGDISAIIAMNGASIQGSMAIAFEEACFLSIVSRMLGEDFNKITPEISDAAGEICNQIFGVVKRSLNESGYEIKPALPSVVIGPGHQIRHFVNGPVIAMRFKTESGFFTVETSFSMVQKNK